MHKRSLKQGKTENIIPIPKPFMLLAGISGTGKTRFVREQAKRHRDDLSNYCLIAVRPDWHEPSDLVGYISRLGQDGPRYITTAFLHFIVAAWKEVVERSTEEGNFIYKDNPTPYWLCLDEMNLAPVEQYFADYLATLETRCWQDDNYSCEPMLNAQSFQQLDDQGLEQLRHDLDLNDQTYNGLWNSFLSSGIEIPPNLIVAGTVNMDESTHSFSRKVIDRAFTLDFGAFFPNNFQDYFQPTTQAKTLGYATLSQARQRDLALVRADPTGALSMAFLEAVNSVLKATAFELAFRAMNELLIALVSFKPNSPAALQAVWDDFLMTKVLPRITGDSEKLHDDGETSLLTQLEQVLEQQLADIWQGQDGGSRPDLLRESIDGDALTIHCRSKEKLGWMQQGLVANGFTAFWP